MQNSTLECATAHSELGNCCSSINLFHLIGSAVTTAHRLLIFTHAKDYKL